MKLLRIATLVLTSCAANARDLHVDPTNGDDHNDGVTKPTKTITQAIKFAQPGDTVHLLPVVYRDYAGFYNKRGEPDRPITLDGHGATLEGSEPLNPDDWPEVSPGLFRCDHLLRTDAAIIGRWFLLWDGRMNHMGRTSKGPSAALKAPEELQPGEWTFVQDKTKSVPGSAQIFGAFYLKLPPGQKLADTHIAAPLRSAGVQLSGTNAHLVIRNLTATHVYNDGYNIHGSSRDVVFENIRALECGDDGISAHDDCQCRVDGFVSIGNSTGICDVGDSVTDYNRVFIRDCLGFDLYFLDTNRHSVTNAVVLSSAARTLTVTGREKSDAICSLTLGHVFIHRVAGPNEVRVAKGALLDAHHVTLLGLKLQATGGEVRLRDSLIATSPASAARNSPYDYLQAAAKPRGALASEILLWPTVKWIASNNHYDLASFRHDKTSFTSNTFAEFQKLTGQEVHSEWDTSMPAGFGADLPALEKLAVPPGEGPIALRP